MKISLRAARHENSSFVIIRRTLAILAFIAGASFCLIGKHKGTTFYYLNQLPISWIVYGSALIIAAVLLFIAQVRPIGYLIGAIVYSVFSIAAWLSVLGSLHIHVLVLSNFPKGVVGNFFAACNITSVTVLYWIALKYSIDEQVDPEKPTLPR